MNKIITLAVLTLISTTAYANSNVDGLATLLLYPTAGGGVSSVSVSDQAGQISGEASVLDDSDIILSKDSGAVAGRVGSRFLKLVCTSTHCSSNSSYQVDLAVSWVGDTATITGVMNGTFIDAKVSKDHIEVRANGMSGEFSYSLDRSDATHFTGDAVNVLPRGMVSYTADFTVDGTLANDLRDPAYFTAIMIAPFVHSGF